MNKLTEKQNFLMVLKELNIPFQQDGDDIAAGKYIFQFGNKGQFIGKVSL